MKEQYEQLTRLLECLPENNTYKSSSELNLILDKYTKVLNYLNGFNEAYKRATNIYFTGITNIRDNINQSVSANTFEEKNIAFNQAKCELKSDLYALAILIQPSDALAETSFHIHQVSAQPALAF